MSRPDLTCDAAEPLLAPWAEGRLEAADASRVEAHLAACRACRDDAAAGRAVHQLLRDRAGALREQAPPALQAAVRQGPLVAAFPAPLRASRWVPAAAAAALLVAVGAGAFAGGARVFAAQLALDHLKCVVFNLSHDEGDRQHLEQAWQNAQGWPVDIPSGAAAGVRLTALRQCVASRGRMAHVMYERDGQTLSLFITRTAQRGAPEVEIMGFSAATRTRGDRTYTLVADLPPADASALLDRLLAELG
jgi:anti-sigma factor RsiW